MDFEFMKLTHLPNLLQKPPARNDPKIPPIRNIETIADQSRSTCDEFNCSL